MHRSIEQTDVPRRTTSLTHIGMSEHPGGDCAGGDARE